MRLPNTIERKPVTFNMTPMIDIVFLLIIFFLVSSHLAQRENRIELDLPAANSGLEPIETTRPRITVSVRANGEVLVAGKEVRTADLKQRLHLFANSHQDEPELRIRCDRLANYEHVQPIMKAAADVGIWDVTFSVLSKDDRS